MLGHGRAVKSDARCGGSQSRHGASFSVIDAHPKTHYPLFGFFKVCSELAAANLGHGTFELLHGGNPTRGPLGQSPTVELFKLSIGMPGKNRFATGRDESWHLVPYAHSYPQGLCALHTVNELNVAASHDHKLDGFTHLLL